MKIESNQLYYFYSYKVTIRILYKDIWWAELLTRRMATDLYILYFSIAISWPLEFKWRDLLLWIYIKYVVCSDSTSELSDVDTDSECESINDISKEEIEEFKNKIKSKGTAAGINYETYVKQFWVGLMEGDGTITVSSPSPNHVKVRMVISGLRHVF